MYDELSAMRPVKVDRTASMPFPMESRAMPESATAPSAATSFVGRKSELETARRVLAEARLLTVTGPIGVGKSRFAARLAEQMVRVYADPAVRIDLASGADGAAAADALRGHAGIVILDGADGQPGASALALRILREQPGAAVVATSTAVLGADGEHLLELRPFVVPPRAQAASRVILDYDAMRLLVDRIRMVDPGFTVTPQELPVLRDITAAADGLPAAIELAAAATRYFSLEAVRDGLRSPDSLLDLIPAAARTVAGAAAAIASCDRAEHRLLTTASLLREPLTMPCLVSLVADEAAQEAELAAAFARLVDRSVLISDPDLDGAFRMLRSTRRAARLALDAAGGAERATHRIDRHLVELMTTLSDSAPGPAEVQMSWHLLGHRPSLERLFARMANDPETAGETIRLIVRLRKRWAAFGLAEQVQGWLDQAIRCRPERDALTAEALRTEAYFAIVVRDFQRSAELLSESLEVADVSEEPGALPTEFLQALVRLGELDIDAAETQLEEVVERTRLSGRVETLDEQLFYLTLVNVMRGNHARADQLFRTSVDFMHARGNRWGVAYALVVRSISLLNRGLDERAGETAREALAMMDSLGDLAGVPTSLRLLAALAHRHGDSAKAATLLAAASRMHGSRTMARDAIGWGLEASLRKALGSREFSRLSARGRQLDRRGVLALAFEDDGPARAAKPAELTRRESEIAELLVEGLSSAEIAARLVLSTRTVEGHIQRMLHKLQFRSRSQIAVWMRERMDAGVRVLAS